MYDISSERQVLVACTVHQVVDRMEPVGGVVGGKPGPSANAMVDVLPASSNRSTRKRAVFFTVELLWGFIQPW